MIHENPIDPFLQALRGCGGSDLHLVPGALPQMRLDGRMLPVKRDEQRQVQELTGPEVRALILATMPRHLQQGWERHRQADYSYDAGPLGRYRVNAFHQQQGPAAVLRRVPPPPASLEELGIPASVRALTELPNGLVLMVGPTGAGKSTTMAALVNDVNERRAGHIITLEDPVEFAHAHKGCVVTQREIGSDVASDAEGVEAALRQDPDVVVLGEVRRAAVLEQALAVAETGHLVFTTIHRQSAPGGMARMVGLVETARQDETRKQLSGVLRGVIAQTLLPRADGNGRIAAFEVLLRTSSTVARVREGHLRSLRADMNDRASGMTTLERSLAELVLRGEVLHETALAHANDVGQFQGELRALGCSVGHHN